ncbi:EmrB/QacA subfamily drug resistance transporter [Chryseobacterium vietnamense]|uniref:EmrB/QacA subfamily drug resistance transporter n=1 Tax=Chryseobacterium vietnamense TaxID=866785 RepID=A0ACC6J8N4_9FLAO|nr:MFS transporter [Chryseobacterium vietnamense]MDR6459356.1 EmrB/QacA subfamily drug resistance transporter [Chryseobacterium vietnamense]
MKCKYLKLLVILFGQLLTIMDIFIINVSIPSIQRDLHASHGEMQFMIAAYLIGFASFLITGGRLGDLYGRKKMYIIGLLAFMISSVACGFSGGAYQLVIARFIQGISAAMMAPQVLSMIQILFIDHHERTKAMGWYGITIGIGTVLGQFLGGYFSSLTMIEEPWRLIFLINIPIGLPAIFLTLKLLDESTISVKQSFDVAGVLILSAGLFCATFALTRSEHTGLGFKNVLLMIVSAGILFTFIKNQKKRIRNASSYLIDFELFRYTNFNLGIVAVSFFFIMLDSYFYIVSLFFQQGLKISPLRAGEIIVFQGSGFILASAISVKLILKYGKKALMAGLSFIIVILILQLLFFRMETDFPVFCLLLFLHGLGIGSIIPSLAAIALSGMSEKLIGNASGVYNTFQQIAAIFGIVVVGSVFYYFLGEKPDVQHYHEAFSIVLLINIFCLIFVMICVFKVPDDVLPELRRRK